MLRWERGPTSPPFPLLENGAVVARGAIVSHFPSTGFWIFINQSGTAPGVCNAAGNLRKHGIADLCCGMGGVSVAAHLLDIPPVFANDMAGGAASMYAETLGVAPMVGKTEDPGAPAQQGQVPGPRLPMQARRDGWPAARLRGREVNSLAVGNGVPGVGQHRDRGL